LPRKGTKSRKKYKPANWFLVLNFCAFPGLFVANALVGLLTLAIGSSAPKSSRA
jgi:hypothetical protein